MDESTWFGKQYGRERCRQSQRVDLSFAQVLTQSQLLNRCPIEHYLSAISASRIAVCLMTAQIIFEIGESYLRADIDELAL